MAYSAPSPKWPRLKGMRLDDDRSWAPAGLGPFRLGPVSLRPRGVGVGVKSAAREAATVSHPHDFPPNPSATRSQIFWTTQTSGDAQ